MQRSSLRARLSRIGGVVALLFLAGPARAHFVWVEPAPDAPDAAQVCFGEYPKLREGAPLLERIARVRLFALEEGRRRELSLQPRANHYRASGLGRAPVIAGVLEYGVVRRGNTPPYHLRYEAQWLRGDGRPLSPAELERLSRIPTGLPLAATLAPAGDGRIALTATLRGRPVAAEVAHTPPGESEPRLLRTSAAGRAELPAGPGWHSVRIRVDEPAGAAPGTAGGTAPAPTRTYLSLLFHAAGGAATRAATGEPADDPARLLAEAQAARAQWGPEFPGFSAEAVYARDGREARGTVTVSRDGRVTLALGDPELEAALRPAFASLVMHRRAGGAEYRASWRDTAPHPLGRAVDLNDAAGSWYRIRDRQILQVNRSTGSQRFTNCVLENESTPRGFLPRLWSVAFYDAKTGDLLRVTTTRVTWTWLGDIFLPATLETVTAAPGGTEFARLTLSGHRLLR